MSLWNSSDADRVTDFRRHHLHKFSNETRLAKNFVRHIFLHSNFLHRWWRYSCFQRVNASMDDKTPACKWSGPEVLDDSMTRPRSHGAMKHPFHQTKSLLCMLFNAYSTISLWDRTQHWQTSIPLMTLIFPPGCWGFMAVKLESALQILRQPLSLERSREWDRVKKEVLRCTILYITIER